MIETRVQLQLVTREQETPLTNLLELYLHDMSEFVPIRISDQGRFGYAWLPMYWAEPDQRFAYLIHSDEGLSGFVLVGPDSSGVNPDALEVSEFFVLRRLRRSGVGRAAAHALWRERPGPWVVRVSDGNPVGRVFWARVVSEFVGMRFTERTVPGRHYPWRVFDFDSTLGVGP